MTSITRLQLVFRTLRDIQAKYCYVWVGWSVTSVTLCVCVRIRALTGKRLELSTPDLVGLYILYGRTRNMHWDQQSRLCPVSTGMGDRLRAGIPPWYVTKPNRSTQPCIPLRSLNPVPALIGWGEGGNITSAGWQVTLCDPIWHVSSRSGAVLVAQTAIRFFYLLKSM